LEFLAELSLARFYRQSWTPYMLNKNRTPDPQGWMLDEPPNFDAWKASCKAEGSSYPYDSFGMEYDHCRKYLAELRAWKQKYQAAQPSRNRAYAEMDRRLNSKEHKAQLAEITRRASERSYQDAMRALQQEGPLRNAAMERWEAERAARNAAGPFVGDNVPQQTTTPAPPPQKTAPARPRMTARPGDHPGETVYTQTDDSGLRARR